MDLCLKTDVSKSKIFMTGVFRSISDGLNWFDNFFHFFGTLTAPSAGRLPLSGRASRLPKALREPEKTSNDLKSTVQNFPGVGISPDNAEFDALSI